MTKAKLLMTIFYLCFLPVFLSLGVWQWGRYQYKLELQKQYTNFLQQQPQQITSFADTSVIKLFQPIKAKGKYLKNKHFLLDNQIFKSRYGYNLITPFITNDNILIFVNRGWILREDIKDLDDTYDDTCTITGIAYVPLKKPFLLKDDVWEHQWPKVIQAIDINKMAKEFNHNFFSMVLILNNSQSGIKTFRGFNLPAKPYTHLSYCIQWFLMALALTVLYFFYMRKLVKVS